MLYDPEMTLSDFENVPVNHFRKEVITNFDIFNGFIRRFYSFRHLVSDFRRAYSPKSTGHCIQKSRECKTEYILPHDFTPIIEML